MIRRMGSTACACEARDDGSCWQVLHRFNGCNAPRWRTVTECAWPDREKCVRGKCIERERLDSRPYGVLSYNAQKLFVKLVQHTQTVHTGIRIRKENRRARARGRARPRRAAALDLSWDLCIAQHSLAFESHSFRLPFGSCRGTAPAVRHVTWRFTFYLAKTKVERAPATSLGEEANMQQASWRRESAARAVRRRR